MTNCVNVSKLKRYKHFVLGHKWYNFILEIFQMFIYYPKTVIGLYPLNNTAYSYLKILNDLLSVDISILNQILCT